MKKVIYFLFAISLFVFIACEPNTGGGSSSKPDPVPEATPEPTPTPTPQPQPEPEPEPQPEPEPEPEPPVIVTHTIEYELSWYGDWIEDYEAPASYNEGQSFDLPDVTKLIVDNSVYFEGWYDNSGFEGDAVLSITADMKKDLKFYAKWVPKQTISLASDYTPTLSYTFQNGNYYVSAQMPSNCTSSSSEIYKYGFYVDNDCISMQKSQYTYCSYNFTNYAKTLAPGNHILVVTVEIFDVVGSYSESVEFTVQ